MSIYQGNNKLLGGITNIEEELVRYRVYKNAKILVELS